MPTLLEKKASELDELVSIVHDIQDKAATEDRDLTDIEKDRITALSEAATKLRSECEFLNDQVTSERSWAKLRNDIEANRIDDPPKRTAQGMRSVTHTAAGAQLDVRGWGDLFIDSDAFQNYPGGGTSQHLTVPFELETRAAITTGTVPQQPYMYTPATYRYASAMLDRVGKVTVGGNSVSWVQWTPNPQDAAPVVGEGQLKPEATMTATPVTDSLDTYAHYKEITRQALEDTPQIRSLVENRLRQGIIVALEGAVAAALAAATLPPVVGSGAAGDSLLGMIRVGIATVQGAGYASPNMVLINPSDAADIDIAMLNGTMNGAVVNGAYWGVPVVPSNSVPVGTAYVGDFSVGVQLFNRGQADLYMTDSHADNFLRNILLLLAETRALATVPDPGALAECSVGAVGA